MKNEDLLQTLKSRTDLLAQEGKLNSQAIHELKNDVSILTHKINILEQINSTLLKNRNTQIVKEYSEKLVTLLEENENEEFKRLVEEQHFPVDEYLYLDGIFISENILHHAIDIDNFAIAKYLISHGANVNLPDAKDKWTPLMFAIEKHNTALVQFILAKGGHVDYKDIDGFTPLAVAVDTQDKGIIKMILSQRPAMDNAKELIAMAELYENTDIIFALKEYFGQNASPSKNDNVILS